MPTTLAEPIIKSLGDFTKYIEMAQAANKGTVWYRGCSRYSHKLVPTLFRHPTVTGIDELLALEASLISWFRQRSIPFQTRELRGDWDCLFYMQHSGVPTRLLDWTENPYIALFFALSHAHHSEDAAVWVLLPRVWNKEALGYMGREEVLGLDDPALKGYIPASDPSFSLDTMNEKPVAMYGTHNSARIVAQRGVFTIFGKNTSPMEDVYVQRSFPQGCLVKLRIPEADTDALRNAVISIGITDSVVFPDMEGLARETRRVFGYEV